MFIVGKMRNMQQMCCGICRSTGTYNSHLFRIQLNDANECPFQFVIELLVLTRSSAYMVSTFACVLDLLPDVFQEEFAPPMPSHPIAGDQAIKQNPNLPLDLNDCFKSSDNPEPAAGSSFPFDCLC